MLNLMDLVNKVSNLNAKTKFLSVSSAIPGVGTSFEFQKLALDGGKWHLILAGALLHVPALPATETASLSYSMICECSESVRMPFDFFIAGAFEREIKMFPCFMPIMENGQIKLTASFPDIGSPSFIEIKMLFMKV